MFHAWQLPSLLLGEIVPRQVVRGARMQPREFRCWPACADTIHDDSRAGCSYYSLQSLLPISLPLPPALCPCPPSSQGRQCLHLMLAPDGWDICACLQATSRCLRYLAFLNGSSQGNLSNPVPSQNALKWLPRALLTSYFHNGPF